MYQRSADLGLGVPFNIASYSLLTRIVAHICDLKPGEFIYTIGDAHIYLNHIKGLEKQLTREPRPFPKLTINSFIRDIDDFDLLDFNLEGYDPHPSIKLSLAI